MIQSHFATAALLALAASPAPQSVVGAADHAALHPERAAVYVESPDVGELLRAYESAPVARMVKDVAVRAAWSKIAAALGLDLDAGLARLAQAFEVPLGNAATDLDRLRALVAEVEAVSLSLERREVTPDASRSGTDPEAPPLGEPAGGERSSEAAARVGGEKPVATLVIVDFSDVESAAAFRAWLEAALAPNPESSNPTTATGEVRHFAGAWTLALRGGSRLAIGLGAADPGELVQRAAGGAPAFAGDAMRSRLARTCGEAQGACVARGAVRAAGWLDAAADVDGALATIAKLLPRHWLEDTTWRMHLGGDRFVTDLVLAETSGGAAWTEVIGSGPVSAGAASYVPDDAIGAALFTIDVDALYTRVAQSLGKTDESNPLAELETKHGFRLKEDVFDSLGGGCAAYLLPIQSVLSLPGAAIVLELRDSVAFERGVTGLMQAFQERADAPFQTKFKRYRDTPMWTLASDESEPSNPLSGMASPTLAIAKDRAIVTVSSLRAIKEVKRALGEEGAPHSIVARMPGLSPDTTMLGELDWPALIDGAYNGARAGLALAAAGAELPFDAAALSSALPEAKLFTRFLGPTTAWTRATGGVTHAHVESSFGPETWLGLAIIGGAVADAIERRAARPAVEPVEPVPAETDAAAAAIETTKAALKSLATPLAVYQIELGRYPDELQALVEPTERFPHGFLNGAELPLDGWGRAFAYRALDGGASYRVWSLGANGVDDAGAGDDVAAP